MECGPGISLKYLVITYKALQGPWGGLSPPMPPLHLLQSSEQGLLQELSAKGQASRRVQVCLPAPQCLSRGECLGWASLPASLAHRFIPEAFSLQAVNLVWLGSRALS